MNRKITTEETEKLFQFCEGHRVKHYDLQIELVDHLASYIEERWEINPELSFHDLLLESYGKFGIYKFSKMKDQKEKELQKKYTLLQKKYTREFYRWPKLIFTMAASIILFSLIKHTNNFKEVFIPIILITIGLLLFYHFFFKPKKLNIRVVGEKKFILLEHFKKIKNSYYIVVMVPFYLLFAIINLFDRDSMNYWDQISNNWIFFAISFLIVSFYISIYSFAFYIPNKIKEHFMEQFPEFVLGQRLK